MIKDFVVKEDAKGSEIQLGDGTKIEKADLPKDTVVDGEGTIDKKVVDGEKIEEDKPKKKDRDNDNDDGDDDTVDTTAVVAGDSTLAVVDVSLEETGSGAINENQLGFFPPTKWDAEPEEFSGWVMMYSKSSIDTVWDHVSGLTNEEIEEYISTDSGNVNKMYNIDTFEWADGIGNTFNSNQADVISGNDFPAGFYNFYVGTYTDDGIVALARLDQLIDVKPVPQNVIWSGSGEVIEGYTVDFSSEDDERVLNNLMFYTEKDKYTLVEEGYAENGETDLLLYELSREQLMELAADGRAKWLEQLDGPVTFDPGQKDIYTSETFGKNTYNVCVASVGEEGT